ncbi:hypothetical protein AgCh_008730 [Apium graveolens]
MQSHLSPNLQRGTLSQGAPQRSMLCAKESARKFSKDPVVGISPCSILKDTFRYSKYLIVPKDFGISPDKLFVERSKNSRSFRLVNDFEIGPCKLLSAKDIKFST